MTKLNRLLSFSGKAVVYFEHRMIQKCWPYAVGNGLIVSKQVVHVMTTVHFTYYTVQRHPPPTRPEFKNGLNYTPAPPKCLHGGQRDNFTFTVEQHSSSRKHFHWHYTRKHIFSDSRRFEVFY